MKICGIIALPLVGALLNGLFYLFSNDSTRKSKVTLSGWIASGAMLGSFLIAFKAFLSLRGMDPGSQVIEENLFNWMHLGGLNLDFTLRFDTLSSVFCLIITGVGSLIHLYSISYMHHDEGGIKYFSYLNLFCFMMLNLVLGSNLPHVFLGWEGVGLASYLLIGFWYRDPQKVVAGQKAFVMNRIGDLGFLIAMFVAFKFTGTLDLLALSKSTMGPHVLTVFGLLIFLACTGKSAQIPLFTWLPDAMAGPTPVSALIHAATMVTSGIYLLTRLAPLVSGSELVMTVIAWTGVLTALMSAITACFQRDIKKVLAYSTISQLGFMFLACGVGAFDAGVFHVMTHAFFKALMFLGAGSVIHALHEEQDIFKMGNLRKKLPITFITFAMGWASILGLPPFSGFFSKDEIIYRALTAHHGGRFLFGAALVAALLTAFYMTRLMVLVFFGDSRLDPKKEKEVHESPLLMTIPLMVLAFASFVGGFFGSPIHLLEVANDSKTLEYGVMAISVFVGLIGAFTAWKRYSHHANAEMARDPFQVDKIYSFLFVKGTEKISNGFETIIEKGIYQRAIRFSSAMIELSGNMLKVAQVGSVQAYLMMGLMAIVAILIWVYLGMVHYGKF